MKKNVFLLYGANGYTGRLIAAYASQYGLVPMLAGRSAAPLQVLAKELGLEHIILDLDNEPALLQALQNVKLVLHAAGPFEFTARQMAEACIKAGKHYLDINGDISVFEMLKTYNEVAKAAGVMLMPGVGFDVVPTDCIALQLKNKLPDAIKLELAFATLGGGLSHGTAITMASKLGEAGAVRKDGRIIKAKLGAKAMVVPFFQGKGKKEKPLFVMSIPWGDVSTAHFTTGIPTIETYTGVSKKMYYFLKFQGLFNWLLRTNFIRTQLKKKIKALPAGPSRQQREKALGMVWGRATNKNGNIATASLCGPEGYTITMHAALIIIQKVLNDNFQPGYQTPAKVYGQNLVAEVPGVEIKKD
jgi:short subunit dehydrogenase-like uncharacterized protein